MNLKNGILAFSIFLILSGINLFPREIELQYHEVKTHYSPDFLKLKKAGFDKVIVRSFLNNGKDGGLLFNNDYFHLDDRFADYIFLREGQDFIFEDQIIRLKDGPGLSSTVSEGGSVEDL